MKKLIQAMKMAMATFFRFRVRIITAAIAFMILFSLINYCTNDNIASATMSLNYSEASAGLNPNSTRFNMSEIVSEKVMSRVVEAAGIEDKVAWSDLSKCVSTQSVDSGRSSDSYISTTYQITYDESKLSSKPKHMPNSEDMVKLICNTYKSFFLDNYGDNKSVLGYEPLVSSEEEPYIAINSLEVKVNQIYRYINMRIKENKTYKDEETGLSFISLMKDIENLRDYDIESIYSFILETGVSKDKATLVSLETYKNKIDGLSYDKNIAFYDADNKGIKLYDQAMSAVVMIPSIDEADEYYMSRTKTAVDTMAKNADSELDEATSYKKNIANTNYLIAQITEGSSNNADNIKTAAKMIVELKKNVDRISEDLKQLDISYIKYKTQNYLVFNYSFNSFMQKISMKLTVGVTFAAVAAYYVFLVVINMKKLRKKKNAKV